MPALITWWRLDVEALAPGASRDLVLATGGELLGRWNEPHRRYHTPTHLAEVCYALDELAAVEEVTERDACLGRLAGWFHDAVYAVSAPSGANEAASAALARELLPALGVRAADVATVARLVEETAAHDDVADSPVSQAFHDADLWVLSADEERFDAYCAQVREEYAEVSDPAYAQGRAAVLRPFLDRPTIYRTSHAREQWEPAARANLTRELARLAPPTGG